MKKLFFLLFAAQFVWADSLKIEEAPSTSTKNYHLYFDLGAMYILPQVGVGFRQQSGYLGYDLALKGSVLPLPIGAGPLARSLFWLPWVSGGARLLYYPKPNVEGQWYLGGGITSPYFSMICPNFVVGKSYQTAKSQNRFWQVGVEVMPESKTPLVSFSYGFCL